jgi:hypothetical protein
MSPKPWAVPPRATVFDEPSGKELFVAVGGALSSWQFVEDVIASIFEVLVAGTQGRWTYVNSMSPAERAYGSVVSFDGRAGMVEAAAEAFFYVNHHHIYEARLKDLLKTCRGWSGRRNEVAHGRIAGSPISLNLCALWPSEFSSRKRTIDHRAAFVYNSAQIKEFDRQFLDLHMELLNFLGEFRAWREGRLEEYLGLGPELSDYQTEVQTDPQ